MKITKFGHCCMLIEEGNLRILTDPGMFTIDAQDSLTGIDIVLITHEHQDHIHIPSVKAILKNNPSATIYTNHGVGKLLEKEGIAYTLLLHGQSATVGGVRLEGLGEKHIEILPGIVPVVENTGYFIAERLFYPGDAFTLPGKSVEILALPVAGPWTTIGMAVEYGLKVRPKMAFPVHDGMLGSAGFISTLLEKGLGQAGTKVIIPEPNKQFSC